MNLHATQHIKTIKQSFSVHRAKLVITLKDMFKTYMSIYE